MAAGQAQRCGKRSGCGVLLLPLPPLVRSALHARTPAAHLLTAPCHAPSSRPGGPVPAEVPGAVRSRPQRPVMLHRRTEYSCRRRPPRHSIGPGSAVARSVSSSASAQPAGAPAACPHEPVDLFPGWTQQQRQHKWRRQWGWRHQRQPTAQRLLHCGAADAAGAAAGAAVGACAVADCTPGPAA